MTRELELINAVVQNKDVGVLYDSTAEHFLFAYADVWKSLKDYYNRYHAIPDISIVKDRHPDFDEVVTRGHADYYLNRLREEHIGNRIDEILSKAQKFRGELAPQETLEKMQNALSKLNRLSSSMQDVNVMDFDMAESHFEQVRERARAMGGTPGIPTGFPAIDSAYPTGMAAGDLIVVFGWAQPYSEPILTPQGWSTMGEIRAGDHVVGSDGKPTEVLETYERGIREKYKVTFSDNSVVYCDKDHLWSVQTAKMRQKKRERFEVVSTEQMMRSGTTFDTRGRTTAYKYYIPLPLPISGTPLPSSAIGPYLMGQLLSDGNYTCSSVYLTTNDEDAVAFCQQENPNLIIQERTYATSTARRWIIKGGIKKNGFVKTYAKDKRIPDEYMNATPAERLALLRGLCDGDGFVRPNQRAHFKVISPGLAGDVAGLVRSLGGVAKVTRRVDPKVTGGLMYNVSFLLDETPFLISRKAEAYTPAYTGFKAVAKIERTGETEPMRCIKVAAEDSLYITRDYTLTHNTARRKSLFTTLVACNAFAKGFKPMIVSLEMTPEKVRNRVYTILGKGVFSNSELELGEVKIEDFRQFAGDNSGRDFIIVGQTGDGEPPTPDYVRAKIDQHKPDLVIYDYAQIGADNSRTEDMVRKMKNMSDQFKGLAMSAQIPLLLISSATPDSSTAADEAPRLEQVAYSKQLAYNADLAYAVHARDNSDLVEIVGRKNRNGPLFAFTLDWNADSGVWEEVFE